MFGISPSARFFICKKPMDMRNGFEGLSSAIEAIFKIDITSDAFFVFTNKSKNRMKILYWDMDGMIIWYKRLEKGKFLLKNFDKDLLDRKEFIMLLEGIVPKQIQKRFSL